MLRAKRNNKLLVRLLLAALVQHAHVSLAAVEGLGCLAETTGKTVVDERDAENALQCVQDGHLATRAGFGGNFDFIGDGDGGVGSGLFSVRLFRVNTLARYSCLLSFACVIHSIYELDLQDPGLDLINCSFFFFPFYRFCGMLPLQDLAIESNSRVVKGIWAIRTILTRYLSFLDLISNVG